MRLSVGALLCVVVCSVGCGKADCNEFAKTWCARVTACGGTPSASCQSVLADLCTQSTPGGCTTAVDASECVSAANNESCDLVLAAQSPSCTLRCH